MKEMYKIITIKKKLILSRRLLIDMKTKLMSRKNRSKTKNSLLHYLNQIIKKTFIEAKKIVKRTFREEMPA